MKKKLGFALGSGGSRGVAHIGFLQAMEEEGIKPDYIAGCSMGSVVGAAYARGLSIEEMRHALQKLRLLDLIPPTKMRGGFFDPEKIKKILIRYMGDPSFSMLKIPFRCIATDMVTQEIVEFSEGKVLDGVMASSCIPAVFKPVEMGDKRLIDGGVLERVPYRQVKEMGADVVVGIDVLGKVRPNDRKFNLISLLFRMFDICDCELVKYKINLADN